MDDTGVQLMIIIAIFISLLKKPKIVFGPHFFLLYFIPGFTSDWFGITIRIAVVITALLIAIYRLAEKLCKRYENKKKERELAALDLALKKELLRQERERENRIRAEMEKVSVLKKELIESGLFYESDPWETLYEDNDSDGSCDDDPWKM